MRVSVAKRDGLVTASGTPEEGIDTLYLLMEMGELSRFTMVGSGDGVAICWPLAGEEE